MKTGIYKNVDKVFSGPEGALNTLLGVFMKVIDHQRAAWFLFEHEGNLYLDANCSHSAFSYCYMIKLSAEELAEFKIGGHEYLDKLAYDIHYSAPAVKGSTSKYIGRDVSNKLSELSSTAIQLWRNEGGGQ
ncbi:MAG: hypothetical protein MK096_14515 [Oleiphilaceae bacterium]|nr:hypothetical protein [Oleiphilaceae bacterium]